MRFHVLNLIYAQIDTEPIAHCDGRFLFVGGYNTSAAARKCPTKIKTTVHRSRAQCTPSCSPPNRTNRCCGLFRVRQKRNKNLFFVNSQLVTTISFLSCVAVSLVACFDSFGFVYIFLNGVNSFFRRRCRRKNDFCFGFVLQVLLHWISFVHVLFALIFSIFFKFFLE